MPILTASLSSPTTVQGAKPMRKRIPLDRLAANILNVWYSADDASRAAGAEWYRVEGQRCRDFANRYQLTRDAVAGAAAAISPGLRWDTVFSHLTAMVKNPGEARVPTYRREFVRRGHRCLA